MKTNYSITTAVVSLLAVMVFAMGCNKTVPPKVAVEDSSIVVSYNKAWMTAKVVDDGGGMITRHGFCYGRQGETFDTLLFLGDDNPFSAELPDLMPSVVYSCMAFADNEAGRGYSELFEFTTMDDSIPIVDTYTVKDITCFSAVPSGQVLSNGGQEVIKRGICYGTEPRPKIEGMHVELGSGVGPFECKLTDLLPDTRYYVCAYAVCTKGVYYGDQLVFDTKELPMAVRTIGVSDVTASRVMAKGEVIRDGGLEVTECGFCWGKEHNPSIEGLHIKASVGVGTFSYYFSGLEKGQTHYVRAYAVNEEGVAYGDELEFVPNDPFLPWPDGTLPGLFSVSENRKVRFSQGNLQFNPDDNVWRFAEDQWDFVGGTCFDDSLGEMNVGTVYANGAKSDNTKVFKYYPGWIDLYGWATSGWDNGNTYYHPYDFTGHISEMWYMSNDCAFYGPPYNVDLTGDYAQADWGVHNTISNGGSRQWRTPSADEFNYLLLGRETPSGILFAKAIVGGVRGLVVLPDDWNASTYPFRVSNMDCDYYENKITCGEWLDVLEPAGAVFLPAAGRRFQWMGETSITYSYQESMSSYSEGNYWTSSACEDMVDGAKNIWFCGTDGALYYPYFEYRSYRCYGFSVRLVSDE
jgi:hypothetical protein